MLCPVMAKRGTSPDVILSRLSALRQAPSSAEFSAELRKAMAHPSVVVVARAAELACSYNRDDLGDDLVAAFGRFHRGSAGSAGAAGTAGGGGAAEDDKQFVARTAVARALVDLSVTTAAAEGAFLAGARAIGGRVPPGNPDDFAADLRAVCAHGLVASRHPDAALVCTDLLADRSPVARAGAVRALAAGATPAAPLLLRLRLRVGDPSADVLADCATELMSLDPAGGLDAVAGLLDHDDGHVRGAAALAIGSARQPTGLALLRRAFAREAEADVRQAILVAAAAGRSAEAVDWLLELVTTALAPVAAAAVGALGPFRSDDAVKRRARDAVAARGDPPLVRQAFERAFD
jgi:hypothetical protein